MKNIKRGFILLGLALTVSSCYYDNLQDELITPTEISFNLDIQPIFNTNCVACHNGEQNPDLRAGNTYNMLISGGYIVPNDLFASKLYQRISGNGDIMPPSGTLSVAKKAIVRDWILQGAKNN